jgi:DNA primase
LYEILESATVFYERELAKRKDVQEYLAQRGVNQKTLSTFRIGFIAGPEQVGWRALHDYLIQQRFSVQEIEGAGLIKRSSENKFGSGYYDVFRSRIMMPVYDSSGRVIAFSGRLFGIENDETPKYINSPETTLFKKGKILYGLDKAKSFIRKYDFSILVEGPFDLLLAHQVGFANTVAVQGTALTADHIERLNRFSKNILLAFDADTAGVQSILKSARIALEAGMDVKVADLPEGSDPADVIRKNTKTWKTSVRSARHVIEFLLEVASRGKTDERDFKKRVRNEVLPFLSIISNRIDRKHFVGVIAKALSVDEVIVEEEASAVEFSKVMLIGSNEASLTEADIDRKTRLIQHITAFFELQKNNSVLNDSKNKFLKLIGTDRLPHAETKVLFALEQASGEYGDPYIYIGEMLMALEEELLKEQYSQLKSKVLSAEASGDEQLTAKYLSECNDIFRQLTALRSKVV